MDNYYYYKQEKSIDFSQSFRVLMRNVYSWMSLGLVITALTSLVVSSNASLMYLLATTPVLFFGLLIAEIGMVLVFSSRLMNLSFVTAGLLFGVYAILNGVTMSFIFVAYTAESIAQTFFIAAGTFGGMSLLGYATKKDLSTMGRVLYMALIGIIIATIVNLFTHNEGMALIINYLGVLIFVGLTAYDTQKIKNMLVSYGIEVNDQTNKLALLGSLTLYLDFVNLFLYLLRIFGKRR